MLSRATVFLVDDDPLMRKSLQLLLRSVSLPLEYFPSIPAFLQAYRPERPGCLLLDLRLPEQSGLDFLERTAGGQLRLPCILITGYATVAIAVRAMKAGALDLIEKPIDAQQLLETVHQALEKDAQRWQLRQRHTTVMARLASLTPRELEVLTLMVAGKPNKIIAGQLGISRKTIDVHRGRIMEKMQAESTAELIRLYLFVDGQSLGEENNPLTGSLPDPIATGKELLQLRAISPFSGHKAKA